MQPETLNGPELVRQVLPMAICTAATGSGHNHSEPESLREHPPTPSRILSTATPSLEVS